MRKDEIEVGGEYAVAVNPNTEVTSFERYVGRLVRCRVVAKDHRYGHRGRMLNGYLVEVLDRFEYTSRYGGSVQRVYEPGERVELSSGRQILHPWGPYATRLASWQAERDEKQQQRDEAQAAYDRIQEKLAAAGLHPGDRRDDGDFHSIQQGWVGGPSHVGVTLEAAERLLALIPRRQDGRVEVSLPVTNGQRAGLEVEEEPGQYVVRLLLDPPPFGLHREVHAVAIPKEER